MLYSTVKSDRIINLRLVCTIRYNTSKLSRILGQSFDEFDELNNAENILDYEN